MLMIVIIIIKKINFLDGDKPEDPASPSLYWPRCKPLWKTMSNNTAWLQETNEARN